MGKRWTVKKALELMSAELDGMCTEQERAALQAHLEACADCRETYRQLRALDEALQDAGWSRRRRCMQCHAADRKEKPARRVWLPAAAIAAAAALDAAGGAGGILSLPGFDRENSVTVNVGSAAERIFGRIEAEAGEPDPAAAEAAALSAETQLDVLLLWGQGTPAELRATPYETTKTGARLYRVTGTLARSCWTTMPRLCTPRTAIFRPAGTGRSLRAGDGVTARNREANNGLPILRRTDGSRVDSGDGPDPACCVDRETAGRRFC